MAQNKEFTEQQIRHQERRKALQELSKIAKMRMNTDCEGMSVNEILIQEFYTDNENVNFKTLHQWSKDGYKINKGSVSFLVWGKPPKRETDNTSTESEDEKERFFPLCYLFSNAQVTKR